MEIMGALELDQVDDRWRAALSPQCHLDGPEVARYSSNLAMGLAKYRLMLLQHTARLSEIGNLTTRRRNEWKRGWREMAFNG